MIRRRGTGQAFLGLSLEGDRVTVPQRRRKRFWRDLRGLSEELQPVQFLRLFRELVGFSRCVDEVERAQGHPTQQGQKMMAALSAQLAEVSPDYLEKLNVQREIGGFLDSAASTL